MTKRFAPVITTAVIAAAVLAMSAQTVRAQATQAGNPVELGIDAVIATTLGSTKVTTISIPSGEFRIGFFTSDNLSIEPRVGINSISGTGSTFTAYKAELGVLYHLDRATSGVYIRPFAGFTGYSGGGSSTQGDVGIGVGTKIPFADRLATRLEANYMHGFSSNSGASENQLAASIGLSFFTR